MSKVIKQNIKGNALGLETTLAKQIYRRESVKEINENTFYSLFIYLNQFSRYIYQGAAQVCREVG